MKSLIIIGAGGFGREVHAWASQSRANNCEWQIKGFLDDDLDTLQKRPCPGSILSRIADYQPAPGDLFVCAMGIPRIKRHCSELIRGRGGEFTNIIHPTAVFGWEVKLGYGVIICPFTVISCNTMLGNGVGINLHATVDHDVSIGDWSQVNCHSDLTGGAALESEVLIGSSVLVLPNIRIGRGAVIGAGAIVMRDVAEETTMAATPARPLRLTK